MPPARKKVTKGKKSLGVETAPVEQEAKNDVGLPVIYDRLEIDEYSTNSEKGPIYATWAEDVLGWVTEEEYMAKMMKENPSAPASAFAFGDDYYCKDLTGKKVRCLNNAGNRHFDESWSDAIASMVLYGQWAGPFTIPGETVNGETIRISRYGLVISGQHQLTGVKKAQQILERDRKLGLDTLENPKYPVWKNEERVFIETIVVKGLSQDQRVLNTVDYVKPRTTADVFYTSKLFRDLPPTERQVLCKMLAVAVDTLWKRTATQGYKTHPEVVAFLDRHPKLLDCVSEIYKLNSAQAGRLISKQSLSAGQCAALLFIQGSSGPKTVGDDYRNESPPSQKNLDWSNWDLAVKFWKEFVSSPDFSALRERIGRLADSSSQDPNNLGLGGRNDEKLALISLAWFRYVDTNGRVEFSVDDFAEGGELELAYTDLDSKGNRLPPGQVKLANDVDFGGIDAVEGAAPPPPTQAEIANGAERARTNRG